MTYQLEPLDGANVKFRRAYIIHHAKFDFSGLRFVCEEVRAMITGVEPPEGLPGLLYTFAQTFDPRLDLLVPVGNVYTNFLAGTIFVHALLEKEPQWAGLSLNVAVFREKQYYYRALKLPALDFTRQAFINPDTLKEV